MQFLTGFALGTQVEPKNTDSTCFGQAIQTKVLLDTFVESNYNIINSLLSLELSNTRSYVSELTYTLSNLLMQYSD